MQFRGAVPASGFIFDAVHADQLFQEGEASEGWLCDDSEPVGPYLAPSPVGLATVETLAGISGREERRRSERRPVDFKLAINPFGSQAVARDLSSTGIYIQTGLKKVWGAPLRLVFHTPQGEIEAVGVVRRSESCEGSKNGSAREGLAIQFLRALEHLPQLPCDFAELTPSWGMAA